MATIEKSEGTDGMRYRVRARIKGQSPRTRTSTGIGAAV